MFAVDEFDRDGSPLPEPDDRSAAAAIHSPAVAEDSLDDDDLRSEIELVADLVVAVSTSETPLSQPDIDRILGVGPA
jgi:hypothetical protein